LAHALISEFVSEGSQSGLLLDAARRQYGDVLATNSESKLAMQGLLVVAREAHRSNEAHDWAMKLLQLDPNDKTAYYNVALADWMIAFPEMLRAGGGRGRIADDAQRLKFREAFQPQVDEAIRMLDQALQIDPNYREAIAYLNLLNRTKASMMDSPEEAARLQAAADALVKRIGPAGREATKPLDIDAPPVTARVAALAPPPPPPPPALLSTVAVSSTGLAADETRPEAIHRENPEMTAEARAANYDGRCVLRITIDTDGNVQDPEVIKSAEYGMEKASLEAVKKWKFRPATKAGKPIAVKAQIEMSFRMR
jgi:TonB family protein